MLVMKTDKGQKTLENFSSASLEFGSKLSLDIDFGSKVDKVEIFSSEYVEFWNLGKLV